MQDTYSLGLMMYEMYTGTQAGKNKSMAEHVQDVMNGARPVYPADTPIPFQSLSESCWAQDPNDRPSDESIIRQLKAMRPPQTRSVSSGATASSPSIPSSSGYKLSSYPGASQSSAGTAGSSTPYSIPAPTGDGYSVPAEGNGYSVPADR